MRCISCKETFESDFKCISYPDSADFVEAAEMATLDCPYCGYSYTHESGPGQPGKHGLNLEHSRWLKDGQIWLPDGSVGGKELARSDIASFWLKGTSAAFATWSSLVLKYLQAMKEFEETQSTTSLKATVNLDQGLAFFPPKSVGSILPEDLKARALDLGEKVVPFAVRFMMATIDVQNSKFVVQVHGIDKDGSIYTIDRFDLKKSDRVDDDGERLWVKPSTYIEDWKLLIPQVIEKSYPLADGSGRRMKIKTIGCDSGGRDGVTSMAYDFWRYLRDVDKSNHHVRFQLLKGDPKMNSPTTRLNYPDSERTDQRYDG
jgi:phage terminase large subunit GpA-like protein